MEPVNNLQKQAKRDDSVAVFPRQLGQLISGSPRSCRAREFCRLGKRRFAGVFRHQALE
jgi:hypothetical protein